MCIRDSSYGESGYPGSWPDIVRISMVDLHITPEHVDTMPIVLLKSNPTSRRLTGTTSGLGDATVCQWASDGVSSRVWSGGPN
eukprot:342747-Rhodomonas_salina.2